MTFTEATDRLTACPTLETLADELGASYGLIRQARLAPDSAGYRNPPTGWERAVAKLARQRAAELVKLADQLEGKSRRAQMTISFIVKDMNGKEHHATVGHETRDTSSSHSESPSPTPTFRFVLLDDGRRLERKRKGRYMHRQTGEIFISDDPKAP